MKSPKNIAASIRQRLLNKAKDSHRPFNELLQYFAMERFLYRLSKSEHANRFILKGALMLRVWKAPESRPTMDIDMLGKTINDETSIKTQISEILLTEVELDGLVFECKSIKSERITEEADYQGIRVRFLGTLDSAKINMQIDIGFGDIVHPAPEKLELPAMLDYPGPNLLAYSRESAIAEKFEAMVKLGALNSRMKDFYDIWLLSRQFDFDGSKITEAIRRTFVQRGTHMPEEIDAFSKSFTTAKQVQWKAFCNRLKQENLPFEFSSIILQVENFLSPIAKAINSNQQFSKNWMAAGTWK